MPIDAVGSILRSAKARRPPSMANVSTDTAQGDAGSAVKGRRPLWIGGGFVEVPVYDRYRLGRGHRFDGPALIEERESTVVLAGRAEAGIGALGEIRVRRT